MFRVPQNPDTPTFDDTFRVGFFRWLTSKKTERGEWARRRNAAAKVAETNQIARSQASGDAAREQWGEAKRLMAEQKDAKRTSGSA